MNRGNLGGHHKNQSHRDQVKGVRLVLVRFSFAPHTVGAIKRVNSECDRDPFPTAPAHALTETSAINHLLWRTHQSMGRYFLVQVYMEIGSLQH